MEKDKAQRTTPMSDASKTGGELKNDRNPNSTNVHGKRVNKSKSKPLYFWDCADVNKWMKKYCGSLHERYGEILLQQEITGRTLIRMNEIKLEKIGITRPDHRRELMQHILRQRLKHEMTDLKNMDQEGTGFELKLPDSKNKYQSKENKDKEKKSDIQNNNPS